MFFDLDNTILDFSYASHVAFKSLLNHFNRDAYDSYSVYNQGNSKVWKEFEENKITALELRSKRFDLYLDAMGWEGDGGEWNKVYLENVILNTKYVSGAELLIRDLSKDYNIHIVTNGLKEVQRPRLKAAQLEPFLSSITVSDEISAAKPQPRFFEVAMENAGISNRESVLMIGDSYGSDITGGHGYGLKTCWFNHDKIKEDRKIHDFEIHQISELAGILR
nr:YjjG family noncanonical pyrimidine nucleotidase [Portibacter lacus]